jgi:hypothetical protein
VMDYDAPAPHHHGCSLAYMYRISRYYSSLFLKPATRMVETRDPYVVVELRSRIHCIEMGMRYRLQGWRGGGQGVCRISFLCGSGGR